MSLWRKLTYLVPSIRRARDRDMQDELRSLQDMAGPHELGNLTLAAEDARAVLSWTWIDQAGQDLRYALRSMVHNKAFTLLAVVSLALGIGANTAIYSFVDAILFRPLPVTDPHSLVVMKWRAKGYTQASSGMSWSTGGSSRDDGTGTLSSIFPYPALKVFEDSDDVLSSAFSYFVTDRLSVTVHEQTDSIKGQYVSGRYFQGMGVAPIAGRLIQISDDDPGSAGVAILSDRFSRRRFGDPEAAVGQPVRINDKPFVVIGVTPAAFFGAEPGSIPDIYIPMHADAILGSRRAADYLDPHFYWVEVMARVKPGVSLAQAQAALAPRFLQFAAGAASTENQKQDLPALTIQQGATGLDSLRRQYAQPVYILMTMVGLILLIACSNIANLLLARATARRREIAVRLSIGASRWRVIRQLLTESVLLASFGGALGVAVAWWGIRVLTQLLSNGRENFTLHAELNWQVLGVTLALSLLTGLLFGLIPALQATRVDVAPALKEVRASQGPRRWRGISLRHALVVTQIAFSLLLLVGAGLFGRTLSKLHAIPTGFNRENVLLFTIRPASIGYKGPALARLFEDLRERIGHVPGVLDVSLSSAPLPMGGGTMAAVSVVGLPPPPPGPNGRPRSAVIAQVGPAFFKTMQIPLTAGREFTSQDDASNARAVVVNRRFVETFAVDHPVGSALTMGPDQFQIVGVVQDALAFTLKEDLRPAIYFSYLQSGSLQSARPPSQMTYEIRTAGNPLSLAATVRETVRQVDSRLAIHDLKTQAAHIDQAISTEITLARLCSAFAALALIIACVGLYGTVAFNVARRTNEIGIRMTLGAPRARIVWMVLREVLLMAAAGLAIGIPLVLAGSRYVKSLLYEVAPNDPVAIALGVAALLVCGLLAGFIPARRASRIDPMVAVRHE